MTVIKNIYMRKVKCVKKITSDFVLIFTNLYMMTKFDEFEKKVLINSKFSQ